MENVIYDGCNSMYIIPDGTAVFNANTGKFNGINTWDTWKIIPSSRPVFNPPAPKTNYIDVPGANGVIDATELLDGFVAFNNREGSFEFLVVNGHKEWYDKYSQIMQYLHGRKVKVILKEDRYYFYQGRMSVNEWKSDKPRSTITIDYNMDPYKYEIIASDEDWLWDPFRFPDGIIRNYKNIIVRNSSASGDTGYKSISADNNYYPVVPIIKVKRLNILPEHTSEPYLDIIKYGSDGVTVTSRHTVNITNYNIEHKYRFYDTKLSKTSPKIGFMCGNNDEYSITVSMRGGKL